MNKLGNIIHELKVEHNKQKKRGNKMTKIYRKKTLYITRTITLIMVTITVLRMMQIEGWF